MVTYLKSRATRSELIRVAMGDTKADVVLQEANLVNVISGEIYKTDIALKADRIALVGEAGHCTGENTEVIEASGLYAAPGLIDGHIHIESTMLTVEEFSYLAVPHGTTSVNADAHEISNVLGIRGFRLFHDRSRRVPLRIFMVAPSSVPLTGSKMEIPSKRIDLKELTAIVKMQNVLGLSEVLNTTELLKGSPNLSAKIQIAIMFQKYIDGNAPGLSGKELNAYLAAGPQHDHEAITAEEALERLRLGFWVMFREGSSERNLSDLAEILKHGKVDSRRCCFATDDKDPRDLAIEGHIDHCLRKSISAGIPPVTAVQMATLNCAEYMGLERELGSISPGKMADIVLFDDLESLNVRFTLIGGKIVARNGKASFRLDTRPYPRWATKTVRMRRRVTAADLLIHAPDTERVTVRVLDVTKGTIISEMKVVDLPVRDRALNSDVDQDVLKVAVAERYGKTNLAVGKGFTIGFGLKHGAIASSVAHDAHNIICVGTNDLDMVDAMNQVVAMQGGLVAVKEAKTIAQLELRLAGIMSVESWKIVSDKLAFLHQEVREELDCKLRSPYMVLAFESSASVPELKVSTRGLIDVSTMRIIPLVVT